LACAPLAPATVFTLAFSALASFPPLEFLVLALRLERPAFPYASKFAPPRRQSPLLPALLARASTSTDHIARTRRASRPPVARSRRIARDPSNRIESHLGRILDTDRRRRPSRALRVAARAGVFARSSFLRAHDSDVARTDDV
jgi:hypothetical protein|tara:strand:- start:247 stop:675 length:429 start_codon:yes stop_codon:yes gene_type:complete